MDYYDTIIAEHDAAEAAQLLADECRKKDDAIEVLAGLPDAELAAALARAPEDS